MNLSSLEVRKMRSEVSNMGSKLKSQNQKLLDLLQTKNELEVDLAVHRDELKLLTAASVELKSDLDNKLKKVLIEQKQLSSDPSGLLVKKIMRKHFKKKFLELKDLQTEIKRSQGDVEMIEAKLDGLSEFERGLNLKILALEEKLQNQSKSLGSRLQSHKGLKKKLGLSKKKRSKVFGPLFKPPVKQFSKYTHKKKGVYFQIKGRTEVINSRPGKVIYVGSMSGFGNIVMVKHKHSKISVFLGPFLPRVSLNEELEASDLVGYTNLKPGENGSLYFEVRNKNLVQNTIHLIDRRLLY
ncbi:MAG: peptidoglycan DD-metalloendopeptidase family protein [Bacteriovoracaceae bacterium]